MSTNLRKIGKTLRLRTYHRVGRPPWLPRPRPERQLPLHIHQRHYHGHFPAQTRNINVSIKEDISDFEQLALKAHQYMLWMECWTKLSVIDVNGELIVANIDPHYLKELEEDLTGYSNNTIGDLITNLRTTWCRIQNQ